MEPVYATVAGAIRAVWKLQGLKISLYGYDSIPRTGGALIAINHTGYVDFPFAGLPSYNLSPRRWVRFMTKQEVFANPYARGIMRGCKHIPVDREQGADAFQIAVDYLKSGELVGIYPEATISRSFELKEFKTGVARMAIEANVPIIPHIVWGAQRLWTKGYAPHLGRTKIPIIVAVGEAIYPTLPASELLTLLRTRMQSLLEQVQDLYAPYPPGEFWVPYRLGGGAPSVSEALYLEQQDAQQRIQKRQSSKKTDM